MKRDDLCEEVRRSLQRLPEPYNSHYGVIPPRLPRDTVPLGAVSQKNEKAIRALGTMTAEARKIENAYQTSRILIRREALASSSIEGTHSTLDELLEVEETHTDEGTAEARQVRDYALILDEVLPRVQRDGAGSFSLDLIRELHQRVMRDDNSYQDSPGDLRTRVVWIGGSGDIAYSTFNPPPPAQVESCLQDVIAYMMGDDMQVQKQGLLTRIALAHAQFEAIHPFRDGNGRVGRLLIPLMMAAEEEVPLYLAPYIEMHKVKYYEALKGAQQRLDWAGLVDFFAGAVIETVDEVQKTRNALSQLETLWSKRKKFRLGSASYLAIGFLSSYPVLTVNRLMELLGVSFNAANKAVADLKEHNILSEKTGYRRNRVFVAKEVLSILNRPFGYDPVLPEN